VPTKEEARRHWWQFWKWSFELSTLFTLSRILVKPIENFSKTYREF
jgi:hypothetical protein